MPLPDYYTALLWTRTMGPKVLDVTTTVRGDDGKVLAAETSSIRVYAHCGGAGAGVPLLAINLGNRSTTLHLQSSERDVSILSRGSMSTEIYLCHACSCQAILRAETPWAGTTDHLPLLRRGMDVEASAYVLSPSEEAGSSLTHQGGLLGTNVMLNGHLLALTSGGQPPPTTAQPASTGAGLAVPPTSIAFFTVPVQHPDCSRTPA
jgi:hypothetical protein